MWLSSVRSAWIDERLIIVLILSQKKPGDQMAKRRKILDDEELELVETSRLIDALRRRFEHIVITARDGVNKNESNFRAHYGGDPHIALGLCENAKALILCHIGQESRTPLYNENDQDDDDDDEEETG